MPPPYTKFIVVVNGNFDKPGDTVFRSACFQGGSHLVKLARETGCYNYKNINNLYWKPIDLESKI